MGSRVLVVDDEVMALQNFLLGTLNGSPADFVFFEDSPEKIASYAKEHAIDGAFLDVNMPSLDGFSLGLELRAMNPSVKIVYVTGLTLGMDDVPAPLKDNVLGFVYKPIDAAAIGHYVDLITSNAAVMKAHMFGDFDCSINGRPIKFSSSKSRELLAYLLANRGQSVSMDSVITALWPDVNIENSKKLYRDAVWRLRKALNDSFFPCVDFRRALISLSPDYIERIHCDYWGYLDRENDDYNGVFLPSYDWSIDYQNILDRIEMMGR